MDAVPFRRTIVTVAPAVRTNSPDNTFKSIVWSESYEPLSRADFDADLARLADPVPATATRGQLVRVLHEIGELAKVKAAVARADELTQELWLSPAFDRDDPLLLAIAEAAGLAGRLDELFRRSASIE